MRAHLRTLSLVSVDAAARKALEVFCTPLGKAGKDPAPILSQSEPLSFRLEGRLMRGHRWSPANATPHHKRVLIAHGFQSYSGNFEQYVPAFLAKGYEVLAFDAPAHGHSEGRQITLPQYVKMLTQVRAMYGPFDAYIGHSFGGLALTLMLEAEIPDPQTRLVLIAPACEVQRYVHFFFDLVRLNESTRVAFDQLGRKLSGREWSWFSIRRALRAMTLPILWVQDEDDTVTPLADAKMIQEDAHPNIEWMITKGLGHRRIYRDPGVEKRIVHFITDRTG